MMFGVVFLLMQLVSTTPAAPVQVAADANVVIVPTVHFPYAGDGWDTLQYGVPIRVSLPLGDLAALRHPLVRLFSGRFVKSADDPANLTVKKINGCGLFPWRKIDFTPSVSQPDILVGQLFDSDYRCVHTGLVDELADTDFYLVVEEGGRLDPIFRLDLAKVDDYFEFAYRFTVEVPKHRRCNTGTATADRIDRRDRVNNHKHWAAKRRQSLKAEEAIALADVKITCVDVVKQQMVRRLPVDTSPVVTAGMQETSCPAIDGGDYR